MSTRKSGIQKSTTKRDIILLIVAVFLLTLPFLNKAVHVDDIYILAAKDNILNHPLNPYGFDFDFAQGHTDFYSHYSGPPTLAYYFALISLFLSNSLILFHLFMIIFPLSAVISLYFLSKKYVKNPLWPPLLMLSTPTFLVTSHNFMPDVPVASMFILSITLFLYGLEKNSRMLLLTGAIAAGAAMLLKYTALLLFPLIILICIISGKASKMKYLLISFAILLSWSIPSFLLYGNFHLVEIFSFYESGKGVGSFSLQIIIPYVTLIISQLSHFGGASIFPLALTLPFLKGRKNRMAFLISMLLPLPFLAFLYNFSSTFISGQYSFVQLALLEIFISSAFFFLYLLLRFLPTSVSSLKNPLSLLSIWFFTVYAANSLVVGGAARYNTLLLAPLAILFCVLIESHNPSTQQKRALQTTFILTLLLGIGVAVADYTYADSYREFAQHNPTYKTQTNTVWFLGHGGFAYYMKQEGYSMLPALSEFPRQGDYIIKAQIPFPRPLSGQLFSRIELISTTSTQSPFPLRVEHPPSHAGLYTYGSGFLPYSFSTQPLERFEVYKVIR